jgi:mRNA interferase MazF
LVVQADAFNRSRISTVLVAALTSNLRLGDAPGNLRVTKRQTKLPQESVINVSQILTIDRSFLLERVSRLQAAQMTEVDAGLRLVLGLGSAVA